MRDRQSAEGHNRKPNDRRTRLHQQSEPPAEPRPAATDMRNATCPACGHHVAVPFLDGGRQPLTTLAWPRSEAAARAMPRLPLDFVRCVDCGHIYNAAFDYAQVPYSEKPNLMFNRGRLWGMHLARVHRMLLDSLPPRPTVVEIGCGSGHLLNALAAARPDGRYVGFDRNAAIENPNGLIEPRAELFQPARHLAEYCPDMIVSRHVLEHLMNPLGFVQSLAYAASCVRIETKLFIEVPCVDHVLEMGRTTDFFYEHNSHFTTTSLRRMLRRCASHVELVARGYHDEVIYGVAKFACREDQLRHAREAARFADTVAHGARAVRRQLEELAEQENRIAIWGGTGKAAAFINQHELDSHRFPIVVDSDPEKEGTFVPGTGQQIRSRDWLLEHPVETVLIATQWRAADIVLEMQEHQISYRRVLLEHRGRLVDFFRDDHPYHDDQTRAIAGRVLGISQTPHFTKAPLRSAAKNHHPPE